jgi:NAD-dependent deacetylase
MKQLLCLTHGLPWTKKYLIKHNKVANPDAIHQAASLIASASYLTAFTGAGISAEGGIPPFRGVNGIWNQYDPIVLDIDYFNANPEASWKVIHQLFYEFFRSAQPNPAHQMLADWQKKTLLKQLITQNIDHLHQHAGSTDVVCFHGSSLQLICQHCKTKVDASDAIFKYLPPTCKNCNGILKPDFIFFGEGIPEEAYAESKKAAKRTDVMLIVGTSGEVSPANMIPVSARQNGAAIIEINLEPSLYTQNISTIFLQGKASEILSEINRILDELNS